MRNDLRTACVHCALRLPARFAVCPRCRGAIRPPDQALAELARDQRLSARVGRPLRDAFLFYPVVLLAVASALGGIGMGVAAVGAFDANLGARIAGAVVGLSTGVAVGMIFSAMVWCGWALLVLVVSLFVDGQPDRRLHPAPWWGEVAAEAAPPQPWAPVVGPWVKSHQYALFLALPLILLVLELVGWLLTTQDRRLTLGSFADTAAPIVGGQFLTLVAVALPFSFGVRAGLWMVDRARVARHLLRDKREATAWHRDLSTLRAGRTAIAGAARSDGKLLVAPLSGERCLGFRLVGHIGNAVLDDAETAAVAIELEGGERVAVRAETLLLDVPPAVTAVPALDAAARQRLRAFLAERHLAHLLPADAVPLAPPDAGAALLELGETVLREGGPVMAWGAVTTENEAAGGYRESREVRETGDGDGRPVLLATAPD